MFLKIPSILKRNFLVLSHSKLSSLILILGPIFLILIMGFGLSDTGLKNIQTSVYVPDSSVFTENFIKKLKLRSFVIHESSSLEECISSVKTSDKNICIHLAKSEVEIPPEFKVSLEDKEKSGIGYEVNLHVDLSKQRIVWGIISQVQKTVDDFSNEVKKTASSRLKESFKEYSLQIKEEREKIDIAMGILQSVNSEILITRSNFQNKESDIKTILKNLNDNLGRLEYISPEFYKENRLYLLVNDVKNLRNLANFNDIDNFFEEITDEVNELRRKLIEIDSKLKDLEDKLSNFGEINLNYVSNPIPLYYNPVTNDFGTEVSDSLEFLDYLFPSFLGFFILFVSTVFTSILIINERKSNAYIRNAMSKASNFSFNVGNFLSVLLIVFLQLTVLLFIADFFVNFSLVSHVLDLIFLVIISSTLFVMLGVIIGYLFNSQETAIIGTISVVLVFIMFSSLITPIETLPEVLRVILQYTPLVLMEDYLRKVLVFEMSFMQNLLQLIILSITAFCLFIVGLAVSSFKRYNELN